MGETLYDIAKLLTIYKLCCLFCGSLFSYLGYKLFIKGIYPNDGELSFEGFNTKLYLKRIGPGIFFALFGSVIICVTIFQPLNFEQNSGGTSAKNYASPATEADVAPTLPDSIK